MVSNDEMGTGGKIDLRKRLEAACMPIMEEWVGELASSGSPLVVMVPEDDLRVYAFVLVRKVLEHVGQEMGVGETLSSEREDFRQLIFVGACLIVDAIDAQVAYTEGRSARVARYAGRLAGMLKLSDDEMADIEYAARIHNLGLINTSQRFFNVSRQLSPAELTMARNHSHVGADMLKPVEFLTDISWLIRYHHANYDGSGYPNGVGGDQIPIGARIIRIADAFEALTADRPQRPAMSRGEALQQLQKEAGRAFDPKLLIHAGAML
jgi:response regulator RpfG family c-di-GMP phosphodiesterase